jgi:hypothetical protein
VAPRLRVPQLIEGRVERSPELRVGRDEDRLPVPGGEKDPCRRPDVELLQRLNDVRDV